MKKEKEEEGMGKEEKDPRKGNGGEEEVGGEGGRRKGGGGGGSQTHDWQTGRGKGKRRLNWTSSLLPPRPSGCEAAAADVTTVFMSRVSQRLSAVPVPAAPQRFGCQVNRSVLGDSSFCSPPSSFFSLNQKKPAAAARRVFFSYVFR